MGRRKLSEETIQEILSLYHSGESIKSVAKAVRAAASTVSRELKARGVEIRSAPGLSEEDRFWTKVCPEPNSGCWLWLGYTKRGYGTHHKRMPDGSFKKNQAHRWAYEFYVGPIPEGLELDHLCRNRTCVNPAHLEPVTHRENVLRSPDTIPSRALRGDLDGIHRVRAQRDAFVGGNRT